MVIQTAGNKILGVHEENNPSNYTNLDYIRNSKFVIVLHFCV